jgi:hypothetical protein
MGEIARAQRRSGPAPDRGLCAIRLAPFASVTEGAIRAPSSSRRAMRLGRTHPEILHASRTSAVQDDRTARAGARLRRVRRHGPGLRSLVMRRSLSVLLAQIATIVAGTPGCSFFDCESCQGAPPGCPRKRSDVASPAGSTRRSSARGVVRDCWSSRRVCRASGSGARRRTCSTARRARQGSKRVVMVARPPVALLNEKTPVVGSTSSPLKRRAQRAMRPS